MSTQILASSASKDGICKLIAHYWYTEPEHIRVDDDGIVYQRDTVMPGYVVIVKRKRWQFRMRVDWRVRAVLT